MAFRGTRDLERYFIGLHVEAAYPQAMATLSKENLIRQMHSNIKKCRAIYILAGLLMRIIKAILYKLSYSYAYYSYAIFDPQAKI